MVDVSEWAKREAERVYGQGAEPMALHERAYAECFAAGMERAVDLLLSDEAVSEAVDVLRSHGHDIWGSTYREAFEAAVSAVTTTEGSDGKATPYGPDDDDEGFWVDDVAGIWYSTRDNTEVFFGRDSGSDQ
jgi:hypothetical protein